MSGCWLRLATNRYLEIYSTRPSLSLLPIRFFQTIHFLGRKKASRNRGTSESKSRGDASAVSQLTIVFRPRSTGITPRIQQICYCFVRNLDFGGPGLGASDVWQPYHVWWPCYRCLVLVFRIHLCLLHRNFWLGAVLSPSFFIFEAWILLSFVLSFPLISLCSGRALFCIPYSRRNVLRHQTRGSSGGCGYLGLGDRLV